MIRSNSSSMVVMIASLLLFACNQTPATSDKTAGSSASEGDTAAAKAPFFPVSDYLRSEITLVDSTPVGIMKYTSSANHTDSGYISSEEFHRLADEFLPAEISDSSFAQSFEESSFLDRATGDATFFYAATNESAPVKRIDIVTAKGDVYDNVKSIYMEKYSTDKNTSTIKKLFWKPKRNFQIIVQVTDEKGEIATALTKVVWDNRE